MKKEILDCLIEAARRVYCFHDGDLHYSMIFLSYPSHVKLSIKSGYFKPYSNEIPRVLNWYKLTEKGIEEIKRWGLNKSDFKNYEWTSSAELKVRKIVYNWK